MPAQNCNLHVVYDGRYWAIAVEGTGRIEGGLELTKAIAIATSLALERRILLYIHDKQGWISKQIDFSVPDLLQPLEVRYSDAEDMPGMRAAPFAESGRE